MSRRVKNTRMCIGCRATADKSQFFSINSYKESIYLNLSGEQRDGRAAYVCKKEKCLDMAIKKKAFPRALRLDVPVDIINELREHIVSLNLE